MKATTVICLVLGVWICGAYCSTQMDEDQSVVELAPEYSSVSGHRAKRSPLDPIVAPLLIGKSFLYGALVGPKLFKPYYRPYYHHYHYPIHHYPKVHHGYYGGGHHGGYWPIL